MEQFRKPYFPALISAAAGMLVFLVSLNGTYIYDDVRLILQDVRIRNPNLWHLFWTKPYHSGADNLFRPIASMSYAIQWWLHGNQPWAFHLVNILLHAAVCVCVAEFARRLIDFKAAIVAGLVFAVHPIHVEVAANIAGRPEMLCAMGILISLILTQKPLTYARAFAIAGGTLLAMLSKEQGLLCPVLILFIYLTRKWAGISQTITADAPDAIQKDAGKLLAFLLCMCLVVYIIWRETYVRLWWDRSLVDWTVNPMIPGDFNPTGGSVGIQRILVPISLIGRYAALLIAPINQSIDYGASVTGSSVAPADLYLWIGFLAIATWITWIAIAFRKKCIITVFLLLGFALTYGMIGNIVALIGTIFGERLIYTPSALLAIAVAIPLAKMRSKVVVSIFGLTILAGSVRTIVYAAQWNEALNFYKTSAETQPKSVRIWTLLTQAYVEHQELDQAMKATERARQLAPNYAVPWLQAGDIALQLHRDDEAAIYFAKAAPLQGKMIQKPPSKPATTQAE